MAGPRSSARENISFFPADIRKHFHKKLGHFQNHEDKFAIPDGGKHHSTTTIHKQIKHAEYVWYKVKNTGVIKEFAKRQNDLIVLTGELFRFEIGDSHPKYRSVEEKDTTFPISKGVRGYQEFFKWVCVNYKKLKRDPFLPDSGRVILNCGLVYDNDKHFGNFCLDHLGQFITIDHDRAFWPVSVKFHAIDAHGNKKYAFYSVTDKHIHEAKITAIHKPTRESLERHLIENKNRDFIGTFNATDFENLPVLTHFMPSNWQFMSSQFNEHVKYDRRIAQDPRFLAEKHFAAIKYLATAHIKNALVDIHIEDKKDHQDISQIISTNIKNLKLASRQNEAFHQYLINHRLDAFKAILFEIFEFLRDNKHYRYAKPEHVANQYKLLCGVTIFNYTQVLAPIAALSTPEIKYMQDFADRIYRNDLQALREVQQFYRDQQMTYRSNMMKIAPGPEEKANPEVRNQPNSNTAATSNTLRI